jgi:hypothetical protein
MKRIPNFEKAWDDSNEFVLESNEELNLLYPILNEMAKKHKNFFVWYENEHAVYPDGIPEYDFAILPGGLKDYIVNGTLNLHSSNSKIDFNTDIKNHVTKGFYEVLLSGSTDYRHGVIYEAALQLTPFYLTKMICDANFWLNKVSSMLIEVNPKSRKVYCYSEFRKAVRDLKVERISFCDPRLTL